MRDHDRHWGGGFGVAGEGGYRQSRRSRNGALSQQDGQVQTSCFESVASLGFEVTDVTRPLVVVRRIVERGNELHFDEDGGWIRNVTWGSRIPLKRKGGWYVLMLNLLADAPGSSGQA